MYFLSHIQLLYEDDSSIIVDAILCILFKLVFEKAVKRMITQ